MDLSVGGPPSQTPWSLGIDGRPLSSRLGPHHPPPPPLVPIQPQRGYVYHAGPVDTRRGYGPPVSQPSWVDQVEYQDMLDLANYQQWLMETGSQPNYLPPLWTKPRASPNLRVAYKRAGRVKDRPIMSPFL